MTNNFINLEVAIDEFCENCFMRNCSHDCDIIKVLRKIPAADVRPVVHGEWLEPDDDYGYLECSVCEERSPNDEEWSFCPNCGADMR